MAASPEVSPPLASAVNCEVPFAKSPAASVPAPMASAWRKNERRLMYFDGLPFCSIISSHSNLELTCALIHRNAYAALFIPAAVHSEMEYLRRPLRSWL